ncbi:MAG: DivIVA domain-containing protein [Deltaproteobacteria bacterium]|nr:DivIVA domain-containing protein [Deltaproteobacteria bacterium]
MRITPLEIQNHQFSRRISGVDSDEVSTFLTMVADDCQGLVRENEQLKDSVRQLEKRNDELASGEKILRDTLVSAQAMAEKLRETAVAESDVLLSTAEIRAEKILDASQSTAEIRAEKILDASHRRAATLSEEIRELRGMRTRVASSLRSTIATHLSLIDRLEQDDDEPIPQLTGIMRKYRAADPNLESDELPPKAAKRESKLPIIAPPPPLGGA